MGASVFDCCECGPIAQFKGTSGLLEIRAGKIVQMQAIARSEYQMIESTELGKEGCNGSFVRDVNCLPLPFSTDGFSCFLNSFRAAGGDNNARSLRCRLLGDRQTNSRRTAQHNTRLSCKPFPRCIEFSLRTLSYLHSQTQGYDIRTSLGHRVRPARSSRLSEPEASDLARNQATEFAWKAGGESWTQFIRQKRRFPLSLQVELEDLE